MLGGVSTLRCSLLSKEMSKWLSIAEYWYNTAYHSALGRSPFEVLYGNTPRHLGIKKLQLCSVPNLEQWMKERELLSRIVQQQLERAQQRMKSQADKNRSERTFAPGDMVYMKLQPYVQTSVAKKLSFRYYADISGQEAFLQILWTIQGDTEDW
jgi:Rps23 Pro-64 3,4-dihydroxylase Tpa1-like proline 4-hydroxylase